VLSAYIGMLKATYYEVSGSDLDERDGIAAHLIKRRIGARKGRSHDENKRIVVQLVNERFGLSLAYQSEDRSKKTSDDDIADAIAVGWSVLLAEHEIDLGVEGTIPDGISGGRRPKRSRRSAGARPTRRRRAS
jgi:hypothetical protein